MTNAGEKITNKETVINRYKQIRAEQMEKATAICSKRHDNSERNAVDYRDLTIECDANHAYLLASTVSLTEVWFGF